MKHQTEYIPSFNFQLDSKGKVVYDPTSSLISEAFRQGSLPFILEDIPSEKIIPTPYKISFKDRDSIILPDPALNLLNKETPTEKTIREYRRIPEIANALVRSYNKEKQTSFWREEMLSSSYLRLPSFALLTEEEAHAAKIEFCVLERPFKSAQIAKLVTEFIEFKQIPGWEKVIDKTGEYWYPRLSFIHRKKEGSIWVSESKAQQAELQVAASKVLGQKKILEFEKIHILKNGDAVKKDIIHIVTKNGVAINCVADSYYGNGQIEPYLVKEWIEKAKTRFIPDVYTDKTYPGVIILVSNDLDFKKLTKAFDEEAKKPKFKAFKGKIQLHNFSTLATSKNSNPHSL